MDPNAGGGTDQASGLPPLAWHVLPPYLGVNTATDGNDQRQKRRRTRRRRRVGWGRAPGQPARTLSPLASASSVGVCCRGGESDHSRRRRCHGDGQRRQRLPRCRRLQGGWPWPSVELAYAPISPATAFPVGVGGGGCECDHSRRRRCHDGGQRHQRLRRRHCPRGRCGKKMSSPTRPPPQPQLRPSSSAAVTAGATIAVAAAPWTVPAPPAA
ncbi:hypothetical protein I4F81_005107 [Pyropia yezoensis]|uniref:Uncharacterized protein n=1 Tax=Pyropia yezoensis TaxID=2788 RepID=A0ACC3BXV4_PYRYE|nr:hypothetical protein I4F81_005107 [Neopyropia yezoensis]